MFHFVGEWCASRCLGIFWTGGNRLGTAPRFVAVAQYNESKTHRQETSPGGWTWRHHTAHLAYEPPHPPNPLTGTFIHLSVCLSVCLSVYLSNGEKQTFIVCDEHTEVLFGRRYSSSIDEFHHKDIRLSTCMECAAMSLPPIVCVKQKPGHVAQTLVMPGSDCAGVMMLPMAYSAQRRIFHKHKTNAPWTVAGHRTATDGHGRHVAHTAMHHGELCSTALSVIAQYDTGMCCSVRCVISHPLRCSRVPTHTHTHTHAYSTAAQKHTL